MFCDEEIASLRRGRGTEWKWGGTILQMFWNKAIISALYVKPHKNWGGNTLYFAWGPQLTWYSFCAVLMLMGLSPYVEKKNVVESFKLKMQTVDRKNMGSFFVLEDISVNLITWFGLLEELLQIKSKLFWLHTFSHWWSISILIGVVSVKMRMSPFTGHEGLLNGLMSPGLSWKKC